MAKGQLPPFLANKQGDKKQSEARAGKLKDAIERRMKARGGKPGDINGPGDNVHTKKTGKK